MTPRVDIEEAVIAQLKDIAEIEKQCIADGWSEKAFLEAFENKYSIILSAVSAGRVIGFLNGTAVLDEAELLNIAVMEEYRGMGAGGALISCIFFLIRMLVLFIWRFVKAMPRL